MIPISSRIWIQYIDSQFRLFDNSWWSQKFLEMVGVYRIFEIGRISFELMLFVRFFVNKTQVPFSAFIDMNLNENWRVRVLKQNYVVIVFFLRIRTNLKGETIFRAICGQYLCWEWIADLNIQSALKRFKVLGRA